MNKTIEKYTLYAEKLALLNILYNEEINFFICEFKRHLNLSTPHYTEIWFRRSSVPVASSLTYIRQYWLRTYSVHQSQYARAHKILSVGTRRPAPNPPIRTQIAQLKAVKQVVGYRMPPPRHTVGRGDKYTYTIIRTRWYLLLWYQNFVPRHEFKKSAMVFPAFQWKHVKGIAYKAGHQRPKIKNQLCHFDHY